MSKKCPNCSEELKDDALVCEKCGQELTPEEEPVTELAEEEPVTELAEEAAPEEEPVIVLAEEEAASATEGAEAVTQEAYDEENTVILDDAEPADQPEPEAKPAKKPLSFGLGLGIGIGIAALIAAIVCGVMMIMASSGPAAEVQKYINAYKDGNYEEYYSYDYSVMFKYQDLETRVEQAEQLADSTDSDGLQTKVLNTISLTEEVKKSLIDQLETAEYLDTDKIEDIKMVALEVSNSKIDEETGEVSDSERDYWASVIYAFKVDGKWYFTTSF